MSDGQIGILKDDISEKLDELADLSEYWKKHRDKGRTPYAIRSAMMMLSNELVMLEGMGQVRVQDSYPKR